MKNPSDNWEELRRKVLGLGDSSVRKTHYPSLRQRLAELERLRSKLQQSEAYLLEAQRLSHTGSFGWRPSTGEIFWSEGTFRIFEYDPVTKPTVELVLDRVHPEDRAKVQEQIERATRDGKDFDREYRLLMPNGSVKHVHVVAHATKSESGTVEFVGAVMDITTAKQVEEKISQQEMELRQILDLTPQHIGVFGPDGSPLYGNHVAREYFGVDIDRLLTESRIDLFHPDDRERFLAERKKGILEGAAYEFEARLRRHDGMFRCHLFRLNPLKDERGHIIRWYSTATDIEDRKQAEERLAAANEELRTALKEIEEAQAYLAEAQRLSHTGSWAWSPDQDIRYWSEECYRVLGFDPRDGVPRMEEFIRRIHPDDQEAFRESAKKATHTKLDEEVDYRIVHPGGAVRDIHSIGHPVFSPCGNLIEYTGTVIDITERKRAEEERRRSEMELQQMLDFTPQLVAVFGPNRERLYVNRITLDYLGTTLDEWRQRSTGAEIHPEDSERLKAYVDRASSSGSGFELELRVRKGDGSYRWFLARYNPLRDDKGQITRWYVALTDIEDRKKAEERLQHENVALREEVDKASMFEEIVGTSPALRAVLSGVAKVARMESTVLITGETGTGKELIARAIHKRSPRSSGPFVSVNCAAIPQSLIASELFGHEKGAFTGALQRRTGRFELAERGTIFLDEVGDLPAETQVALLRVLQEREFERVGGSQAIRADVRVIAATNRDLKAAIASGAFRSDLFYRLNVFPIQIPALRERREDIPMLANYFIDRYARRTGRKIKDITKKTFQLLQSYSWPGNIRELQNVIERSVIVCETETLTVDESWISSESSQSRHLNQPLARKPLVEEKEIIESALARARGKVWGPSGAAAELGIPPSTLDSKIRTLKIDKYRFKSS